MRISNHTFELEQLLAHLVVKTVTALTYLAKEGLVRCRDWHTRNIAFSNVSTVVKLSDMRLLDWTGHNMEPCTPGRDLRQFTRLGYKNKPYHNDPWYLVEFLSRRAFIAAVR